MLAAPNPTELTRPYWESAKRHVLVRPVCSKCGKNFFTPQVACPKCLSEDWAWVESSGVGRIYSATIVHKPPYPGIEVPYVFAIVALDEGWHMLANILNCEPRAASIGTRVRVNWQRQLGEYVIPNFEPLVTPEERR
jgi:hypothetical protein